MGQTASSFQQQKYDADAMGPGSGEIPLAERTFRR
jgi:hypothetical protein